MPYNHSCPRVRRRQNWQLMKLVSDSLQMHGIASIRFDFNGHGESEGDFKDMTVPNEIEDLKRVVRYALQLDGCNGKIGLLGHSQGGVVVSMTAGEMNDTISAVTLLAPAAVLREDAIRGNTFGVLYNPINPPEYVELPGGRKLGREYILTAFRLPIYETAIRYQGAAFLIHGTGDRVAPILIVSVTKTSGRTASCISWKNTTMDSPDISKKLPI